MPKRTRVGRSAASVTPVARSGAERPLAARGTTGARRGGTPSVGRRRSRGDDGRTRGRDAQAVRGGGGRRRGGGRAPGCVVVVGGGSAPPLRAGRHRRP